MNQQSKENAPMAEARVEIEKSSGNVWADAGREDATEAQARAELLRQITSIIRHRHLTQTDAAKLLGTTQPTISDLMRGKLSKFSFERLFHFLVLLGRDVEIVVRPKPRSRKSAALRVAA
jgi:predicted XRE-type DNA-binding protein